MSNQSVGNNTDKCLDHSKGGVYVPACEYNKALSKANENPIDDTKGLVEQFVGLAAAVAAYKSLSFSYTKRSSVDCSQNKNATYTLKMLQAGAVAFIIGELKARKKFKEASQLSVDETFSEDDESKDTARQVQAFENLMKVYDYKKEGLEEKTKLSKASQIAYTAAAATELGMVVKHKMTCSAGVSNYVASQTQLLAKLSLTIGKAGTAAANYLAASAFSGGVTAKLAEQCASAVTATSKVLAYETQREALQKKSELKTAVEIQSIKAKETPLIGSVLKLFTSFFAVKETEVKTISEKKIKLDSKSVESQLKHSESEQKKLTESLARNAKTQEEIQKKIEMLEWKIASLSIQLCPEVSADATQLKLENFNTENRQILCCGSNISDFSGLSNYYGNIPAAPGVMDSQRDIEFKKLKLTSANLELMKPALFNAMEQYYFNKTIRPLQLSNPVLASKKLKVFYQYMNYLETNFENELKNNPTFQIIEKQFLGMEKLDLAQLMSQVNSFFVPTANAIDLKELLGFGFKLYMINKVIGELYVTKALVSPKNRIYTFGALAAIQTLIVNFNDKKLEDNQKYLEAVKAKYEEFKESHKSDIAVKEGKGDKVEKEDGGDAELIALSTDSAIDSSTPSINKAVKLEPQLIENSINSNIPNYDSKISELASQIDIPDIASLKNVGISDSGLFSGLDALRNSTALSGGKTTSSATGEKGLIASGKNLDTARRNVRSALNKAILKSDGLIVTDPESGFKEKSISSMFKEIDKDFGKGISGAIDSSGTVAEVEPSNIKKNKDKNTAGINYNAGKYSLGSFNPVSYPQLDDSSFEQAGSTEYSNPGEQSLNRFALDTGEIISDSSVSIFKTISNRYLRSYPLLMDKKKKE